MTAPAPLRGLRAAFVFLTRVPVGGFPYTDDEWRWAAAHFPLVGALLGVVVGAVDHVLLPLGELAAALGAIGASLFLAGALHEDRACSRGSPLRQEPPRRADGAAANAVAGPAGPLPGMGR